MKLPCKSKLCVLVCRSPCEAAVCVGPTSDANTCSEYTAEYCFAVGYKDSGCALYVPQYERVSGEATTVKVFTSLTDVYVSTEGCSETPEDILVSADILMTQSEAGVMHIDVIPHALGQIQVCAKDVGARRHLANIFVVASDDCVFHFGAETPCAEETGTAHW